MKKVIITAVVTTLAFASFAQISGHVHESKTANLPAYPSRLHIGLGFGLDYGGIGVKIEYLPIKYVGIFGSAGYNFLNAGFNIGIQGRPLPDAKVQPIVLLMYGYNAVINVNGLPTNTVPTSTDSYNKAYYGLSSGIGGELRLGRKGNRLYTALLYPFRSEEFKRNYDELKNAPYIKLESEVLPVAFSIGFNWVL
jgi:hypothetical protein